MTPRRSRSDREVHHRRRSAATFREPPSIDSPVSTSDEGANSHGSQERWGNFVETKKEKTVRIVFQNLAGLANPEACDMKLDLLRRWVQTNDVDIFGGVELGTCWDLIDYPRRLPQLTRGWWEAVQWSVSYNRLEKHSTTVQPGGTGIAVFNKLAHHAQKAGDDPTGLGRWSWVRLKGQGGRIIRIIALYRPCRSDGPLSTYQQHCRGLTKLNRNECPRAAVLTDLTLEVRNWQEEGDEIILLTDFNEDVRSPWIQRYFEDLNLVEALTYLTGLPPTATHNRGSTPIDGIYISPALLPSISGGYLAFETILPSDHRALWIDVPGILLGLDETPHLRKPQARRLQCRDPRVVKKYVEHLTQTLEAEQVFSRFDTLRSSILHHRMTKVQQYEYEVLDRTVTSARISAEKHCRKFKMGQVPWTPDLTRKIYRVLYWKGVASRVQGRRVGTSVLRSRARKAGIHHLLENIHLPLATIHTHIAKALRQYRHLKKDTDRRDTWLGQIIEAQAQATGTPKTRLWKQIRSRERVKLTAKQVKLALGKTTAHRPLAIVSEPMENGSCRDCHTRQALEQACLDEAGRRFTQANFTPCLQNPIWDIFGDLGITRKAFDQVLNGTFVPPDSCDPFTRKVLTHLSKPAVVRTTPDPSIEEYIQGWKKAREETSSSYSNVHFGHYIAGSQDERVASLNAGMAALPAMTGYSPNRWRHGLNVMLEKAPGNIDVERLRIILLFEADCNQNNKWIGRAFMREAERHDLLAVEQYGSRRYKDAITQCLNKRLWYDYIRSTRQPAALCSNDAKSCYDRIVLLIAALCMCRLGASKPSVLSMLTTIRDMRHHTRTVHGDSTRFASRRTWNQPVAGIGQGNGAGPAIWAAVSSPLFAIMQEDGFLAQVLCAITSTEAVFSGFAFVDDTDLCVSGQKDSVDTAKHMQHSVTNWEGLLRTTGGALVPDKCFWYLISQQWKDGKWYYQTTQDVAAELKVVDSTAHLHTIPRLEVTEARRTLGVRLAPDGNSTAEFQYLKTTADEWKQKMEKARLTHTDAMFSLRSSIMRKMAYPLAVTTFTENQCHDVMKPILNVGLPKIGCNRSMPRSLVHGPLGYAGLNLPHLYTEQAVTQLTLLMRYGSHPTDHTGLLLRAVAEAMQLETGIVGELLQTSGIFAPLVTDTWLKRLWLDCLRYHIEIQTDLPTIPPRRLQDIELMRVFTNNGYRGQELSDLNRCRMSLHAIWLSDICDGTGTEVLADYWNGIQPTSSTYSWPPTHTRPSDWRTWQKALHTCLGLDRWRRLGQPLGKWLPTSTGWFYEPLANRLWFADSGVWQYFGYIPSRSRTQFFDHTGCLAAPIPFTRLRRAVVLNRGSKLQLAGYDSIIESSTILSGIDGLRHSSLAKDWNMKLQTMGRLSDLKGDIQQGYGYIVSDGSFSQEAGAAAWIIEGRTASARIIGTMITPGNPTDHSSFRSELAGIYGALCTLEALDLGPTTQSCRVACDGKSALDRIQSTHPILPTEPHADLLQAIRSKTNAGICIQWCHVKGHQDGTTPTVLTRDAWLNIEADLLAKAAVDPKYHSPIRYRLPGEGWICHVRQHRVVKQLANTLRDHINTEPIEKYWKKKFQITEPNWSNIDWEGVGRAYRESPPNTRRWATKHTSGFFAHGKNMMRWQLRTSAACPRCGQVLEDKAHITQCPEIEAGLIWQRSLKTLEQWFRDSNTAHELSAAILWGLQRWRDPQQAGNPPTAQYVQEQTDLGWDHFLDGWLVKSWRLHQDALWKNVRSRRSSKRWIAELIKKLWNVSWDLWAHRNGILHTSPAARQEIIEKQVNDQIRNIYAGGTQALSRDAIGMLRKPLEHTLQLPLATKQQWMESIHDAIARKQRHEYGNYLSEQRFMAHWLGQT